MTVPETDDAPTRTTRYAKVVGGAMVTLTVLAVVFTLYAGRDIILPVVLAFVLNLLLAPGMRFASGRLRLPRALTAVTLILGLFAGVVLLGFTVTRPATAWVQKVPESLPALKERIPLLRTPIEFVEDGLQELQGVTGPREASDTEDGNEGKPSEEGRQGGTTLGRLTGVAGTLATGTANVLSLFLTTMIVLFFMLVSGHRLQEAVIANLKRVEDKEKANAVAHKIEDNITGYLVTITLMNVAVGVVTALAMWACGLGTPLVWGAMAFLLNYIPILGPMTGVVIFFTAGILTLGWPVPALLPAGLYLGIHLVEGETITPMLLAQRFTLNPVLVIVALFFWHGIWGIPGALLAVPLLAVFKIVCDHVEALKPVGRVIGS